MSDTHEEGHHGPTVQNYMVVFGALAGLTLISFIVNWALGRNVASMLIILGVGVIKALLVGAYFMHLKWDWSRLYYLIFPTFILGAMMMMVLLPDIVLAWPSAPAPSSSAPAGPH